MAHVVVLSGDYDLTSQKELRRELTRVQNEPEVTIDLSAVTYLDSTAIAELLLFRKSRRENGRADDVTIVRPKRAAIARVLDVTGLGRLFRFVEPPEDGRA